jgi:outer membrane protein, heavy metal efflux system
VAVALQQVRDQVRAYRGLWDRRQQLPADVGFGDLVTAQQTLAAYIAGYATALGLQWTAVVDVANLLQTEDLFQVCPPQEMAPVPDLHQLTPSHGLRPCAPAPAGPDEVTLPPLELPVPRDPGGRPPAQESQ